MTISQLGKDPNLLPTPSLSPDEFEDFTERLLSAHRSCAEPLRRIVRVERWGRRGDKQDGIDFEGTWSDGKSAAWQCKRYDRLTIAQVRKVVADCSFEADEYYLTYSGEASPAVRYEIAKHDKWQLLDRRGLGRMLDDLPLHKQRQVLDATWGVPTRKQILKLAAEDALLSIEDYAADRRDISNLLNDSGPLVGRTDELEGIASCLDRSGDWPPIILVTGPGGRGKTRLVTQSLEAYSRDNPAIPVLCLSAGRLLDSDAFRELPHTPAVIWVDDAHRDPRSLTPLLQYARRTAGTQLVIASRTSGRDQVRAELVESGLRSTQIEEVNVGELSRRQARELVSSLSAGIEVSLAFAEHLAEQAEDSPYVAVLALNMARRGELGGPLALDRGLREQVLLRYQAVLTGDLDDCSGDTVRRILAAYAAIGPVEVGDLEVRSLLSTFSGLSLARFMRLLGRLEERGVLVTRSGRTRVAPDILADQILERESVVGGYDTGFASELWTTFGGACRTRLVVTLSELDWRLTRQGHASIIDHVKASLHDEIAAASLVGLKNALQRLEPLSYTQPQLLIGLLDNVRTRLANPAQEPTSTGGQPDTGDEYAAVRAAAGLPPLSVVDIEHQLGKLYGQCASNAPEVLEQALDALWGFRRRDARETNPHPDHPARVVTENLANLGELPDASFPERIAARVEIWLATPALPGDVATPLFAINTLLAKEGSRYVSTSRREISIRPFLVSPQAVRPLRNSIRRILLAQASGTDIQRASAAVKLLGNALKEPRGMFGQEISDDLVREWEADDLESIKTLAAASAATNSAVIRRIIRRQVEWSGEYSRVLGVRHAALTLLTNLDEQGDDLAEALIGSFFGISTSRKGQDVPSPAELEALMASDALSKASQSDEEHQIARSARVSALIERRDTESNARLGRAVHSLWADAQAGAALEAIELSSREIKLSTSTDAAVPGLNALLMAVAAEHPDRVSELAMSIENRPEGPLDEGLVVLLDAWAKHDEIELLAWLDTPAPKRSGVRHAIATAFDYCGWAERGGRFATAFLSGADDPDERVRNRFLQGSHRLLAADPIKTVELLLRSDISSFTATRALQGAAEYDGLAWGQTLGELEAAAVLNLINRAGWSDETLQLIAAGIARNFPRIVLNHFMGCRRLGELPLEVAGLSEAYENDASELVGWLLEQACKPYNPQAMTVAGLAMTSGMTPSQAIAIAMGVGSLDSQSLLNLADLLYDVPIWALQQPLAARQLLSRALEFDGEVAEAMRSRLTDAMRVHMFGFENGASDELAQALKTATEAATAEPLDALKAEYETAAEYLVEQIAAVGRHYEDEFD